MAGIVIGAATTLAALIIVGLYLRRKHTTQGKKLVTAFTVVRREPSSVDDNAAHGARVGLGARSMNIVQPIDVSAPSRSKRSHHYHAAADSAVSLSYVACVQRFARVWLHQPYSCLHVCAVRCVLPTQSESIPARL